MNNIGEKIKALRKQKNMTQQELVGNHITRNQLSLIERGNTNPSMLTLEYIAKRLDVTTSYLLSDHLHSINEMQLFIVESEYNNAEGHYNTNISAIENFLNNYKDDADTTIQDFIGKLYALLGIAYYETKNPKSDVILQKALSLLNNALSPEYVAKVLNTLAKLEYYRENYAKMKEILLEADKILNDITLDTIVLKSDILHNIALSCLRLKQYEDALNYIDVSFKQSKKYEVYRNYGKLQMLISLIHMYAKNYDKAVEHSDGALQYFSLFINDIKKNHCIVNRGILNRRMGNYSKSIEMFDAAYHFFKNQNDEWEMLNIRCEKVKTKFLMKIDWANIINEAKEILSQHSPAQLDRFDLLIVLGLSLLENADYEAAKASLVEAEKYYDKFTDTEFSIHLLVGLSKIYKQEGNFERAYFYMEKAQ